MQVFKDLSWEPGQGHPGILTLKQPSLPPNGFVGPRQGFWGAGLDELSDEPQPTSRRTGAMSGMDGRTLYGVCIMVC